MRAGAEVHIVAGQTNQVGDAQPGLNRNQQQGTILATGPGAAVGNSRERAYFVVGERGDQCAVETLGRDLQHALDTLSVLGMLQCRVAKLSVNGCQTSAKS